jgi:hypothetical protein
VYSSLAFYEDMRHRRTTPSGESSSVIVLVIPIYDRLHYLASWQRVSCSRYVRDRCTLIRAAISSAWCRSRCAEYRASRP